MAAADDDRSDGQPPGDAVRDGAGEGEATDRSAAAPARTGRGRPWYRRGRVWLVLVVASSVAAWGVSVWAEERRMSFTSERTAPDVALWCDRVTTVSEVTLAGAISRVDEAAPYLVDPTPLRRLDDQAPTEIRSDVRDLAAAVGDMSEAVDGSDDPATQRRALERISAGVRPQAERVEAFVGEVCFEADTVDAGSVEVPDRPS